MKTHSKSTRRLANLAGLLGIGLCGLCCAIPFLGIAAGIGLTALAASYLEKIGLALLGASLVLFVLALSRKQKAPTCDVNCNCKE